MKVLKNLIRKSPYIAIMLVVTICIGELTAAAASWQAKAIFYVGFLISFCILEGIIIPCLELKYIGKCFLDTKA